jgi:transcriptional regulator with XRE-family HTH domain
MSTATKSAPERLRKAGPRGGVIPSPETQAAIRRMRLERDLTYEALGALLGVSRASAWKAEQGKPVYDRLLYRIERALGIVAPAPAPAVPATEKAERRKK